MAGTIGTLQAMEAIKYLIGKGDLLTGKLLTYDALKMEFRKINLKKDCKCAVCGENPTILEPIDYEQEVCEETAGEIDGNDKTIKKVYFLENIDHAKDHFSMDPKEQLECVKDMRANGYQAIGNWHSHPSSPSRPSDEDIKLAYDKGASYLILSFLTEAAVINSFHIENGGYEKKDLRIYNEEYYF